MSAILEEGVVIFLHILLEQLIKWFAIHNTIELKVTVGSFLYNTGDVKYERSVQHTEPTLKSKVVYYVTF